MSETPQQDGFSDGAAPSIPDHKLLCSIGAGSYGEVWLARNVMGQHRAVKIVWRRRFESDRPYEREFSGLCKFEPISRRQESQLDILHVGRDDVGGYFYYVMELADPVDGDPGDEMDPPLSAARYAPRTLRSELVRRGRLPVAECVKLGLQLANALQHLHAHGLVHRDIKPSNIVFVDAQPKLADIGLVTDVDASMSFVGTEGYFPPEGPGSPQADIFALGKVLYEISTGQDRKEFPNLPADFNEWATPDQQQWREFNAVVLKACQPRMADRHPSADELRDELELLQAGQSVRRHHATQRQLRRFRRWGAWAGGVGLTVVSGLVANQWRIATQAKADRLAAIIGEVQLIRQNSRTNGWFDQCWSKLQELPPARFGDELRRQAAACLGWDDAALVAGSTNTGSFHVAFSPDGESVLWAGATTAREGRSAARLWRLPDGGKHSRKSFSRGAAVTSPRAVAPTAEVLPVLGDAVAAWTAAGRAVLFQSGDIDTFVLRDARTADILREFPLPGNPRPGPEARPVLAITSDASLVAASIGRQREPWSGSFAIWDARTGSQLFQTNEPASALAFSPGGEALAVGDPEGRLRVFSVRDFSMLAQFPSTRLRIHCLALARDPVGSSNGPQNDSWWLAAGDAGGVIQVYRTRTKGVVSVLPGTPYDVLALRFSRDANSLASAGRHVVRVWDTASAEELLRIPRVLGSRPDFNRALAFSPDGSRLAIGSDYSGVYRPSISVWRLAGSPAVQTLRGLRTGIVHVRISDDQSLVTALSHDWQIAVWNRTNGQLLRIIEVPPRGTPDNVSLIFNSAGDRVVFSAGKAVYSWHCLSGALDEVWPDLPEAKTGQLAFDGEQRLLSVRTDRLSETNDVTRWIVRELTANGKSRILVTQADPQEFQAYGIALTPNGKYFAAWSKVIGPNGTTRPWTLRLIETLTGNVVTQHVHQHDSDTSAVMDARGQFLAYPTGSRSEVRTIPEWKRKHEPDSPPMLSSDGEAVVGIDQRPVVPVVVLNPNRTAKKNEIPLGLGEPGIVTAGPVFGPLGDLVVWGDARGWVRVADWRAVEAHLRALNNAERPTTLPTTK